jgi:hypothetical protein
VSERCTFCRGDIVDEGASWWPDPVADLRARGVSHPMHLSCVAAWLRAQLVGGLLGLGDRVELELRRVADPGEQDTTPIDVR